MDNIFRIVHVFVDNIVSIDTRLYFCLKSYVAVERNGHIGMDNLLPNDSCLMGGRRKLVKGMVSESSLVSGMEADPVSRHGRVLSQSSLFGQ